MQSGNDLTFLLNVFYVLHLSTNGLKGWSVWSVTSGVSLPGTPLPWHVTIHISKKIKPLQILIQKCKLQPHVISVFIIHLYRSVIGDMTFNIVRPLLGFQILWIISTDAIKGILSFSKLLPLLFHLSGEAGSTLWDTWLSIHLTLSVLSCHHVRWHTQTWSNYSPQY